jgi:hypothetical protein
LEERVDQAGGQKYTATDDNGFPISTCFDITPENIIKIQKEHYIIYIIYYDVIIGIYILVAKIII